MEDSYFQNGQYAVFGCDEQLVFGDGFSGEADGGFEQVVHQFIAGDFPLAGVDVDFMDGFR